MSSVMSSSNRAGSCEFHAAPHCWANSATQVWSRSCACAALSVMDAPLNPFADDRSASPLSGSIGSDSAGASPRLGPGNDRRVRARVRTRARAERLRTDSGAAVARVALGPALPVLLGRRRAGAALLELPNLRLDHVLAVLVVRVCPRKSTGG